MKAGKDDNVTRIVAVLVVVLSVNSLSAQTCPPMITHCTPIAVQRGKTTEVAVEGQQSFANVIGWLADAQGLRAEVLSARPSPSNKFNGARLKITVGQDVPLGPHEFRLVTRQGLSTIGQLLVVDDPVILEQSNSSPRSEQIKEIRVPAVACGRIATGEAMGRFRFHAEKGETFSFEVWGARLQDKIHDLQKHLDPHLSLLDVAGHELAVNDDSFFADPYLTWTAPSTSEYTLQIRDSKYEGDPRWAYALCVTNKPFAAHAFPFAGNPGQSISVQPIGTAALVVPETSVTLPKTTGILSLPLSTPKGDTNPVLFVVSELPQTTDREPNDNSTAAQSITIPCGISGRIGQPHDVDQFKFKGQKGKAIRFEVKARRHGTPLQSRLDSVLEVLTPSGQVLAANDDDPTTGKDSALTFNPQSDGEYVVRIRDLNGRGGPAFVYYLEATDSRPDFTLRCDSDKASISPGGHAAWYVHVNRLNGFTGPVDIAVEGLPAGVTASRLTIPPSMTQGLLVLSAAADANVGSAANVRVAGTTATNHEGAPDQLKRTAVANAEIYLPGGGRGRFPVDLHSVSVADRGDILKVDVKPTTLILKPGEEATLQITIDRRIGFDKDVTLDLLLRHLEQVHGNPLPPGVTILDRKSKTRLRPGESKGHIVVKAAVDAAPIAGVPICVTANVSINFMVKIGYSSVTIPLSIGK